MKGEEGDEPQRQKKKRAYSTGHDPRRPKRDRVQLVGGVRVPHDELAVLRGRDEMALVSRPVHGIDLCQVTLENAARLHDDARQLFNLGRGLTHCAQGV